MDIIEQAQIIWRDFHNSIKYHNRFFVKHQLLDYIKEYCTKSIVIVPENSIFYRARIIDDNASIECRFARYISAKEKNNFEEIDFYQTENRNNDFYGLSQEASFIPPDNVSIKSGRANPQFIKYLYMAKEPTTALFEVRPTIEDRVNLAKIRSNETLRLIDLTKEFGQTKDIQKVEDVILSFVESAFSIPTNNSDDYLKTQVISEYIKELGYDGIMFKSSLHKGGINYTIYNYNKCEAINSRDFKIENFKLTARSTTPWGKDEFWWIIDNEPKPI